MTENQTDLSLEETVGRIQSMVADLQRLGVVKTPEEKTEDLRKVTQQRDLLALALWSIYTELGYDTNGDSHPGARIAGSGYDQFAVQMIEAVLRYRDQESTVRDTSVVDLGALRELRLGLALGTVTGTPQELSMLIGQALGDVEVES